MTISWEDIVDYVRGVASAEVTARIQASPEAMAKVAQMQAVRGAVPEEVPELWKDRAKALVPHLPSTVPLLWGRLVPPSLQPAMGFRSSPTLNPAQRYEFDGFAIEIRREPREDGSIQVVGIVEADDLGAMRVGTETEWREMCDEDGQFALEIPAESAQLRFHALTGGLIYVVEFENVDLICSCGGGSRAV